MKYLLLLLILASVCVCAQEEELEIYLESKMLECADDIEKLNPNVSSSTDGYYYIMGKWHAYLDIWDMVVD